MKLIGVSELSHILVYANTQPLTQYIFRTIFLGGLFHFTKLFESPWDRGVQLGEGALLTTFLAYVKLILITAYAAVFSLVIA